MIQYNHRKLRTIVEYKIFVDADAIPSKIREVIIRYSKRTEKHTLFVSNHFFKMSKHLFVEQVFVEKQIDQADNHIVSLVQPKSLIITQDLLLAKQALEKGGKVLNQYGEAITLATVNEKLSFREFYSQMRDMSAETNANQKPYTNKDLEKFSNSLNNWKW